MFVWVFWEQSTYDLGCLGDCAVGDRYLRSHDFHIRKGDQTLALVALPDQAPG